MVGAAPGRTPKDTSAIGRTQRSGVRQVSPDTAVCFLAGFDGLRCIHPLSPGIPSPRRPDGPHHQHHQRGQHHQLNQQHSASPSPLTVRPPWPKLERTFGFDDTMPATPKKTPRGDELRALVLDTALRLFSQHGYFNTSIHDIRREAGVSIGAIYHHFANKESLAKALYDDLLAHLEMALDDILNRHATCHKRCDAIIAFMFDTAEQSPEMMRFILDAKHREFMPTEKPLCSSRPFVLMRQCIEGGIRSGAVRPLDPWVAATAAFGGAIRMIQLYLDGVLEQQLKHYLTQTQECAWRAIRI